MPLVAWHGLRLWPWAEPTQTAPSFIERFFIYLSKKVCFVSLQWRNFTERCPSRQASPVLAALALQAYLQGWVHTHHRSRGLQASTSAAVC